MLLRLVQEPTPGNYSQTGGYWDTGAIAPSAETVIRGQLMHPDNGEPWAKAKIHWKFIGLATTATTQRPSDSGVIYTDENGVWSVRLWNNANGDQESYYLFKFPNDREIKIQLPNGTPSPIEFSALAIAQTPPEAPSYPSLIELIDQKLATSDVAFPLGGTQGQVLKITQETPRTLGWGNNDPITPFAQLTPATEWIWNHNLGYKPTPQVYNLAYQQIDAEIEISDNQIKVKVNPASPGYILI
jgi:hypothetical protein